LKIQFLCSGFLSVSSHLVPEFEFSRPDTHPLRYQEKIGVALKAVVDTDDVRMIDPAQKSDFVREAGNAFRRAIVTWDPAQKCGFFKDPVHGNPEGAAVGSYPLCHSVASYGKFRFEGIHCITPLGLL
jgi:hypothetical protein